MEGPHGPQEPVRGVILAVVLAPLLASCGGDAAVEVSRCLERGLRDLRGSAAEEVTVVCPLDLEVPHVAVLSPGGPFDPEGLREAGVPEEALDPIRRWREHDPAVYVVPLGPATASRPSMTTAQAFFVRVPRLVAVSKSDPHTSILLRHGERGVEATGVW